MSVETLIEQRAVEKPMVCSHSGHYTVVKKKKKLRSLCPDVERVPECIVKFKKKNKDKKTVFTVELFFV